MKIIWKKIYRIALLLAAISGLFWAAWALAAGDGRVRILSTDAAASPPALWQYQCIDTAKYSRDTARQWQGRQAELGILIEKQLQAIKDLGANCVALGTPYDEEFVPVLGQWVKKAREKNLTVWFRGNLSGWEGWFDYPRLDSASHHDQKIHSFITGHPNLFEDGDIFTPAPEPENGLLGNPFVSAANRQAFLDFLPGSFANCTKAFKQAGKSVKCGYFSVNGDVAREIFTSSLLEKTGQTVVIDNYVDSAERMALDLEYLNRLFGMKIIIGEFGAPIPDINGPMTDAQQAEYIGKLLAVFYSHKNIVGGVNYWVLSGGTTALLREDGSYKPAASVLADYYKPALIQGKVVDFWGRPVQGAEVSTSIGGVYALPTDGSGNFSLLVPAKTQTLTFRRQNRKPVQKQITASPGASYTINTRLW